MIDPICEIHEAAHLRTHGECKILLQVADMVEELVMAANAIDLQLKAKHRDGTLKFSHFHTCSEKQIADMRNALKPFTASTEATADQSPQVARDSLPLVNSITEDGS